jgi:uncharacterized membrane protein YbhN (UPF0104 family)
VVLGALAVVVLIPVLAPGLSDVRDKLGDASPGWLVVAVVLEGLSCVSYVLMFRPVFCDSMRWRSSFELGLAELAVGSIVPASGAGGLAVGAWVLRRDGMPAERIARRSVAFFLIKSSVNFVAVAVIGLLMAIGVGPHRSLLLTALPAAAAVLVIVLILLISRLGPGENPGDGAGRLRRWASAARRSLIQGTGEAVVLVRSGDVPLIAGSIGYWAFDNAVLIATFAAFGVALPLTILLMGYLIGQLGGLLPLPGGVGGIDGGLIGVLVLYGAPAAVTVAAVLAYRLILFWLPLIAGTPAFISLWRRVHPAEA